MIEQTDRQLKAIMFSDVKSFSAMMARDEERTVQLVKEHRQIIRGILTRHDGEEHGTAGDSFFVLFSSAVKAVRCAVEIQAAFHNRNAGQAAEDQIWIRIGIHLGDILVDQSDGHVYGDGINIAARTEPRAEPGGICITRDVFQQVQRKLDIKVVRIGRHEMKNILGAPELYRVIVGQVGQALGEAQPASGKVARRARRIPLVAPILVFGVLAAGVAGFLAWQAGAPPEPSAVPASPAVALVPSAEGLSSDAAASLDVREMPPERPRPVDIAFQGKAFIHPFSVPAGYEAIAVTLAALVAKRLARHFPDGVMTYAEAQSLGVLAVPASGSLPDPIALARATDSTSVILGELSRVGEAVWVSLAFFDVEQNRIVNRVSERSADEPEQIMKALEDGLAPILQIAVGQPASKELVRALLHSRMGFVKHCYTEQLMRNPRLGDGKVIIAFRITEDGRFQDVRIRDEGSTLKSGPLGTCIENTFRDLATGYRFPGPIQVNYPFMFRTFRR